MAEFCLECWNKLNKTNDPEDKYILSDEPDFCEGCGKWTRVIISRKRHAVRKSAAFSGYKKTEILLRRFPFSWCGKWDLNPYVC